MRWTGLLFLWGTQEVEGASGDRVTAIPAPMPAVTSRMCPATPKDQDPRDQPLVVDS